MTCRTLTVHSEADWLQQSSWLQGRRDAGDDVETGVRRIIDDVRQRGDDALLDFTRKFDCPDFRPPFRVDSEAPARAIASIPKDTQEHIRKAAEHIRDFHQAQKETSWFQTRPDGSILGQRILPVDAVGLYVPGGRGGDTPLISTLLMNVIPAQVAGVERIAVCTPPRPDGGVSPYILAAAHLLGIDEINALGGAWAIAALAYGTSSIPSVDVIAGPGNVYVTTAKRLVQGTVGIDMIAGPSEILVIADASANPDWVAADMLSQAEHDSLACALCLTTEGSLAPKLEAALKRQLEDLPRSRIAAESLERWGAIVVVPDIETAIKIANSIAPEHLELCVRDPWAALPFVRHAGAVFMGHDCPEAVGDYFAGPNHVLPTLGTARHSSALSVQTFCKRSSVLSTSHAFLTEHGKAIADLARMEALEAHARSVEKRMA
jgi:histidinol dehydrogenase